MSKCMYCGATEEDEPVYNLRVNVNDPITEITVGTTEVQVCATCVGEIFPTLRFMPLRVAWSRIVRRVQQMRDRIWGDQGDGAA